MVTILTGDEILGLNDLPVEIVTVPQWKGAQVGVRTLTGAERDAFEQSMLDGRGKDRKVNLNNFRAKLVALTAVHPETKALLFKGREKELGEKSAAALDLLATVAQRLNGFEDQDVEALVKNSESVQSEDSISS